MNRSVERVSAHDRTSGEQETTVETLQRLVAACDQSEAMFLRAYRDVAFKDGTNDDLRAVFRKYAEQRSAFRLVLAVQLQALGADCDRGPRPSGKYAGGLVDANETIEVDVAVSVLAACVAADASLVAAYREAGAASLPLEIHVEIERQLLAVADAHDHLTSLEHAFRARGTP